MEHTVCSSALVILQQFKNSTKPRVCLIEMFSFYYGVYAKALRAKALRTFDETLFLVYEKKRHSSLGFRIVTYRSTRLRCLPEVQYGRLSIREHDHRRRQSFILTAYFGPSALSEGIQQFQVSRHAAERRKRNVRLFTAHRHTAFKKM